ncbi:hypothetical protein E2562_039016 [Oryza meyeriana var. granulata]|uniref:Uncharacterized protein n=1 Tax=Oryza meyeriana var. granulata TaxID=110450 RepID=A0A6G1DD16_9ORYZ|nr:hypothetical protein E2562_039016 [Oryza meyeriana var. granulata]
MAPLQHLLHRLQTRQSSFSPPTLPVCRRDLSAAFSALPVHGGTRCRRVSNIPSSALGPCAIVDFLSEKYNKPHPDTTQEERENFISCEVHKLVRHLSCSSVRDPGGGEAIPVAAGRPISLAYRGDDTR